MANQVEKTSVKEAQEILIQLFNDSLVPLGSEYSVSYLDKFQQSLKRSWYLLVSSKLYSSPISDIVIRKYTEYSVINSEYVESRQICPNRMVKRDQEIQFYYNFEILKRGIKHSLQMQGKNDIANIVDNFNFGIDTRHKIIKIRDLERLKFNEDGTFQVAEDIDYILEDGLVTLIYIWDTLTDGCQGAMHYIEDMLKKNVDKWSGKVKIVAISLNYEEEQEDVFKSIQDNNWNLIEHYRMKKGWDQQNTALEILQLEKIPFVTLIDKNKEIEFKGDPMEFQIEDQINRLITDITDSDKEKKYQSRESFKLARNFLRTSWQEFLNQSQDKEFNKDFNLTLKKSIQYDSVGKKTPISYRIKLIIEYKAKFEHKQRALQGVQFIRASLPQDCIDCRIQLFNDPKQEFIDHFKYLQGLGKKYNLPVDFQVIQTNSIKITTEEISSSKVSHVVQVKGLNPNLAFNHHQSISWATQKYLKDNQDSYIDEFNDILNKGFDFAQSVGGQFFEINDLFAYNEDDIYEDLTSIVHVQGQVLIIDFWNILYEEEWLSRIENYTKLIRANKDQWNNKVRFVAISLKIVDEVPSRIFGVIPIWTDAIEVYFFSENVIKNYKFTYQVSDFPHSVIVDQNGEIRDQGSCLNMEQSVNLLLSQDGGKSYWNCQTLQAQQRNQVTDFTQNKNNFNSLWTQLKQLPKDSFKFDMTVTSEHQFDTQTGIQTIQKSEKPILAYWIREDKKFIFDDIISQLSNIISKDEIIIKETFNRTFDIPFPGTECSLCKRVLNDQTPQYYSPFSKQHYCTECAQSEDATQSAQKKYKVDDSIIFINAPLSDLSELLNINETMIGKNIKLSENEKASQQHQMKCYGCINQLVGPRYVEIVHNISYVKGWMQYVDLCHKCFTNITDKNSEEGKLIIEKNQSKQLKAESIFIRILYSHGYLTY